MYFEVKAIEETAEQLEVRLDHPELYADKVAGLKPDSRRRREILAVRCLLKSMKKGVEQRVEYDEEGAPRLAGQRECISISHTDGFVAVALDDSPCGIDIERRGQRVQRVVTHFLTDDELALLTGMPDSDLALHLAWSAKEAAYKVLGRDYYDLQHLTSVLQVDFERQLLLLGVVGRENPMKIGFRVTDDYVLAFTSS